MKSLLLFTTICLVSLAVVLFLTQDPTLCFFGICILAFAFVSYVVTEDNLNLLESNENSNDTDLG